MLSCVDALEAWPSVLPIATGTTPGITTDGMTTVAATNGVASLDHWSGLFMAGDGERAVRTLAGVTSPGASAVNVTLIEVQRCVVVLETGPPSLSL